MQSLSIDRITWRSHASSSSSQAGTGADAAEHAKAAAWLPITVTGVTLVVRKAAAGSKRRKQATKSHGTRNPAAAAAARPAVSTVLAVARRLLPGVPINVQDVTVKLKVCSHMVGISTKRVGMSINNHAELCCC